MLYQVSWLKNKSGTQQLQIHFLVETADQTIIKESFQELKIILLSISKYDWNQKDFWWYTAKIWIKKISYEILLPWDSFEKVAQFLFEIGFDVFDLNTLDHTLEETYVKQTLETTKQTYLILQQEQLLKQQQEKQQEEKKFDDDTLKKLQLIVNQTLVDIDDLLKKVEWTTTSLNIKNLKKLQDDLKKLRLGTNSQKMTEILEGIYTLMESIDLDYLEYLKTNEFTVLKKSFVSNVDLEWEYNKYLKALKVWEVWINQNTQDRYYIFFWKRWVYQKFLQKDLGVYFSQINNFLYSSYDFFVYVLILVSYGVIGAIFIYHQSNLLMPLLHIGVIGTIVSLATYLRKSVMLYLLLWYVIIIGWYFFSIQAIITSFAL